MSALGQKRTSAASLRTSAVGQKRTSMRESLRCPLRASSRNPSDHQWTYAFRAVSALPLQLDLLHTALRSSADPA